ncbi:hypothetical protein B30_20071 [Celeribacter baekdonensis B30]|uniref:Uncharacterized protein n=2 Tax=Rhodobacterales TaxID=204455 RepID=K2ICR7_9RHOB|nr:hypothetical protein B30_20071 [Celeribacter baekdonensis B30]KAB6714167.1 hypothetical protein C8029_21615 [Roseobacter sp. TSBP12]
MRTCLIAVLLIFGLPLHAESRSSLAAAIEDAATNAFKDERHSVEIEGCQMTTYRWRDRPEQGWVLWTSVQVDMVDAEINENKLRPGEKFGYAVLDPGPPEIGFGLIGFTMRPSTLARQERSILREPSRETHPSPRGGGSTHYYEYREEFIFTLEGPGVSEKVRKFPALYDRYVKAYCTFTG